MESSQSSTENIPTEVTETTERNESDNQAEQGSRSVYFSRHGERLDFIDDDWRDESDMPDDAPLTERGERQARFLGKRLKDAQITAIFASPFQRCVRTASLAAAEIGGDVKVHIEPALCERLSVSRYWRSETGPLWQDLSYLTQVAAVVDGISRANPDYISVRPHSFNTCGYPESTSAFNKRCEYAMSQILERFPGNILLVGHVSSVKGLLQALCSCHTLFKQISCTLTLRFC